MRRIDTSINDYSYDDEPKGDLRFRQCHQQHVMVRPIRASYPWATGEGESTHSSHEVLTFGITGVNIILQHSAQENLARPSSQHLMSHGIFSTSTDMYPQHNPTFSTPYYSEQMARQTQPFQVYLTQRATACNLSYLSSTTSLIENVSNKHRNRQVGTWTCQYDVLYKAKRHLFEPTHLKFTPSLIFNKDLLFSRLV